MAFYRRLAVSADGQYPVRWLDVVGQKERDRFGDGGLWREATPEEVASYYGGPASSVLPSWLHDEG